MLIKLSTWSCLVIRMQEEITIYTYIDNSSIEKVEQFTHLGTVLTHQNSTQEEIKSSLKSRNVCYLSEQNLLSSSFPFKNIKIKIYRNINLPVVLCGCETWSLTATEEHRLRVYENRVLRRLFGPKREEVTGSGDNYIMRSLMICNLHPILFG